MKYKTVSGDCWDYIAYKTLGSERYMDMILAANPEYRELAVLPAGLRLHIPAVETPKPQKLPPWRR